MSQSINEFMAKLNLAANTASIAAAYQFSRPEDSPEDPADATKHKKFQEGQRVHELTVLSDDPRNHWEEEEGWKPSDDYKNAKVAANKDLAEDEGGSETDGY
jgi:hypothetical protein